VLLSGGSTVVSALVRRVAYYRRSVAIKLRCRLLLLLLRKLSQQARYSCTLMMTTIWNWLDNQWRD